MTRGCQCSWNNPNFFWKLMDWWFISFPQSFKPRSLLREKRHSVSRTHSQRIDRSGVLRKPPIDHNFRLTVAAAIAAAVSSAIAATAAATGSAPAAATRSASTASTAVPRTIMRTIMTFTGMYGFAVGVFAIEVRLAGLFFVEVTATFDGDGFFRLGPRRRRSFSAFWSGSAFAVAAARGLHLGALFFKDGFARQLD